MSHLSRSDGPVDRGSRLPDFEDDEAEEKAMRHALGYHSFHTALGFFHDWPDPARAAKLVFARHAEVNGDAYHLLAPAADALDARYPLAATALRRAMIEHTLNGAKHTRYKDAVRHLLECGSIVPMIEDYGAFEDHEASVARLRATHAGEVGFWVQLAEMAGTGLTRCSGEQLCGQSPQLRGHGPVQAPRQRAGRRGYAFPAGTLPECGLEEGDDQGQ